MEHTTNLIMLSDLSILKAKLRMEFSLRHFCMSLKINQNTRVLI